MTQVETMLFGLIGRPIGHSRSAILFAERFLRLGLDARYDLYELQQLAELHQLITQTPQLIGLNVTSPYKQVVLPLCTHLSDEVQAIGAANTLLISRIATHPLGYELSAYNTDVYGFTQSLIHLCRGLLPSHALILGTGGAALAVAYALKHLGIPHHFVSRTPQGNVIGYDQLPDYIPFSDLIVQATPVGYGTEDCPDILYDLITSQHLCYDLIYCPSPTTFMKRAQERGARVSDGLEMLRLQADKAWEIWSSHHY